MIRIAVLLHGSIKNDYRVLKTIKTLSQKCLIDVYYISVSDTKFIPPNKNVKYIPIEKKNDLKHKFLRHTFFCNEYNYMTARVSNSDVIYDYVWANDLPTLIPVLKIAKKNNAKVLYDSHEIYTETINQFFPKNLKGLKGCITKFLIRFMRSHGEKTEQRLLPKVHQFITVNESLLNYFYNKYSVSKGTVLMNLPTLKRREQFNKFDFRNKYNWIDNTKIILYQGALNEGRGLKLIISTMSDLADNFRLIIVGEGPLKKELVQHTKKLGLQKRVKFIDFVNLSELPNYTMGADLGVNLLEDYNLSKKMASPNKLFEYIHAGIPIISTDSLESKKVLEKYKVGVLVKNTKQSIIEGIQQVFEKDELQNSSYQFEAAAQYYCWEKQEHILKGLLN